MINGDEGRSDVVEDGVEMFSKRLKIYNEIFL